MSTGNREDFQLPGVTVCVADLTATDSITGPVTTDDLVRARRIRCAATRRRFLARRRVRRTLLARATALDARCLTLEDRCHECGRPHPVTPIVAAGEPVWWSSSSSRDVHLLAIASCQVGVDVEVVDRSLDLQAIARRFFTLAEQRSLGAASARFFAYWTLKEAFLKATGVGLVGDLRSLDCSSLRRGPDGWWRSAAQPRWRFASLRPLPGVVGAVAIRGDAERLAIRHLDAHGALLPAAS